METADFHLGRTESNFIVSEQERARLDEMYEQQGITSEFIQERMKIRQPSKIQGESSDPLYEPTFGHIDVLYVNSSDPLKIAREQCQVRGKRVLTVAGSGEQVPLFKLAGAETVDTFDVSWVAAVWGELKLRAYQILSFDELVTCLQAWRQASMDSAEWRWHPMIDVKIYHEKLRPVLSRTARETFDCLLREDPEHQFSVRGQDVKAKHPSGASTRLRGKGSPGRRCCFARYSSRPPARACFGGICVSLAASGCNSGRWEVRCSVYEQHWLYGQGNHANCLSGATKRCENGLLYFV